MVLDSHLEAPDYRILHLFYMCVSFLGKRLRYTSKHLKFSIVAGANVYIIISKVAASVARSSPEENLLPLFVGYLINYLQRCY